MEMFWKWMEENEYSQKLWKPPYQMLIGYLIEYLLKFSDIEVCIPIGKSNYFENIDELFQDLKNKVESKSAYKISVEDALYMMGFEKIIDNKTDKTIFKLIGLGKTEDLIKLGIDLK